MTRRRRWRRAARRLPFALLAAVLSAARSEPAIGDLLELYRRARPPAPTRWLAREAIALAWFHLTTRPPGPRRGPARGGHEMLTSISHDLRHALRLARRRPAFTACVLLVASLGIGANAALFSVVDALLFDALPFDHVERLVLLQEQQLERGIDGSNVSYPNFRDWVEGSDVFAAAGASTPTTRNLGVDGDHRGASPERLATTAITEGYFETFGLAPLHGRLLSIADRQPDAAPVVVVAEGWWREGFGADPAVVGSSLRLDGRLHTVVGVAPNHALHRDTRIWIPLRLDETVRARTNHFLHAYALLAPGATLEQATEQLRVVAAALEAEHPDTNAGWRPLVQGLRQARARDAAPLLAPLAAVAALVLILACSNVAGLLLSRAADREPEIAVRLALGAGRRRVLGQLLVEGTLLAAVAGALGWLIGVTATRAIAARLAEQWPLPPPALDPVVLAATLTVGVATGLLFSLAPAIAGVRGPVVRGLRGGGILSGFTAAGGRGAGRGRGLLVSLQVALALVLLTVAATLVAGMLRLQRSELGFDPEDLVTLRLDLPPARYPTVEARSEVMARFRAEVAALPGVERVATTSTLPFVGSRTARAVIRADRAPDPDDPGYVQFQSSSPGYLATMGMRLVAGRDFLSSDGPTAPPVAVINETLARRLFGEATAVGERLLVHSDETEPRTVVGVVADAHSHSLARDAGPMLYVPESQINFTWHAMAVRSRRPPEETIPAIRGRVAGVDPDQPVYDVRTMDARLGRELVLPKVLSGLLTAFSGLALVLAASALYALLAGAVRRRRREMALRMALGAGAARIVREVAGHGLAMALLGLVAGGAAGWAVTRFLGSRLAELGTAGAGAGLSSAALLTLVLAVACLQPAVRAARRPPADALRDD